MSKDKWQVRGEIEREVDVGLSTSGRGFWFGNYTVFFKLIKSNSIFIFCAFSLIRFFRMWYYEKMILLIAIHGFDFCVTLYPRS